MRAHRTLSASHELSVTTDVRVAVAGGWLATKLAR